MNTFVRMAVKKGGARFSVQHGKFEDFVCRWEDFAAFMTELLETDEALEAATTVEFSLIQTERDFETWCRENEIEGPDGTV